MAVPHIGRYTRPPRRWRLAATITLATTLAACADTPTEPVSSVDVAPSFDVISNSYVSGSHVRTWNAIPELNQVTPYGPTHCTATPSVGLNANWQNEHAAFVVEHPWSGDYFVAPWINAWSTRESANSGSPGPRHYNWTKYRTQVAGTGSFVIRLLADNCSWIYLDGTLVGVQNDNLAANSYGLTLNGTHTLEFIVFDGGGASGGKFKLETTTNPPPPLNPDLDGDGYLNPVDAFPVDPTEHADLDGDGTGDNSDPDIDGDGVPNGVDGYPTDPTRSSLDVDGDGVNDDADNCQSAVNPDQADLDGDNVGDACDNDIDGDGVSNAADVFPRNPAESADSDGDGIGNNADPFDNSNTGAILTIGTCSTGAANKHMGGGTFMSDVIGAAYAAAANHGAFVNAVTDISNSWKKAGLITGQNHGAIVSCAARMK